jgi:ATP-dependent DNA ligase
MRARTRRPERRAVVLGYYAPDGALVYAGRAGTGITEPELADLRRHLNPLAVKRMPLAAPPPRESRFGSPLELTRVHWIRPKLVVEVTFLSWTADGLMRQAVYQGLREDKPSLAVTIERP